MARKKSEVPAGRGYHHGNLRQALLDAALELIEAGKEQGVSLRTVAAGASVSNAAPYRHFKDREALMAAVATISFERLLGSPSCSRPCRGDDVRAARGGQRPRRAGKRGVRRPARIAHR
jgi:Bacterial regulatory proteins, tetR family